MLHDTERNDAYAAAIAQAVRRLQSLSPCRRPTAIDIGAGSGLLGCLAAREGARVTAFETIPALARLATRVVSDNGLDVDVTFGHSTEHSSTKRAQLVRHELRPLG